MFPSSVRGRRQRSGSRAARADRRPAGPPGAIACHPMRLIIARCEVLYTGRISSRLPMGDRLLLIKRDGTFLVFSDGGGQSQKPENWMTAPTVIEVDGDPPTRIEVRKLKGDERLEIEVDEVLLDIEHEMEEAASLEKDGVERDLQELLAASPQSCG